MVIELSEWSVRISRSLAGEYAVTYHQMFVCPPKVKEKKKKKHKLLHTLENIILALLI